MKIEVSIGEFIDKITILEIKSSKIENLKKLRHVMAELEVLKPLEPECLEKAALMRVNKKIWECEDLIRQLDKKQNYGQQFIDCARDIFTLNDERAKIKSTINDKLKSNLVEVKSHAGTSINYP